MIIYSNKLQTSVILINTTVLCNSKGFHKPKWVAIQSFISYTAWKTVRVCFVKYLNKRNSNGNGYRTVEDLHISKLILTYCPAQHGRIKWSVCHWSAIILVVYCSKDVSHVCCAVGFLSASDLGALYFHSSDCLHVSIHGSSFSSHFLKLSKVLLNA